MASDKMDWTGLEGAMGEDSRMEAGVPQAAGASPAAGMDGRPRAESGPDGWAGGEGGALLAACARLRGRPDVVAGAGGNASWKCQDGSTLLLKASGTRLEDAGIHPILVALDLPSARASALEERGAASALLPSSPKGLRPSIEASLHAILPDPAVLHVHSSAAVALAIRPDAEAAARSAWKDFSVGVVPYARPGLPLARALAKAQAHQGRKELWLLLGHGAIACAGTPDAAVDLVLSSQDRVSENPSPGSARRSPSPRLGWRVPVDPACSVFGTHPFGRRLLLRPAVPDQAVFLPSGSVRTGKEEAPSALVWIDDDGAVFLSEGASSEAEALLTSLAHALLRLPASIPPVPLPSAEAAALGNWEAEKHRLALASSRG